MSEKRFALLIASFEYDDPYFRPLKAPAQDVKALSRVLGDPAIGDFGDVKTLLNEPKDVLVLAIEEFFADRNRDDLLLLYFSCHGIKDEDGRLYYATKNTRHKRLVATAVPAYQVNDLIGKSRSRRKILVLDCCYSGAFSKAFLAKGDVAVGTMEEFKQGEGLVTLTASDAFQYSFEGEELGTAGVCSVFTRALVDGVETGKADRDGDQLISLDELYDYAYERVHSENPQQNPRIQVEVEGKIIIARNPQPPRPTKLPSKLLEVMESPFPEVREGTVRTLDTFLRGRNKGLALSAWEALRMLTEDDSRRVASAAQKCIAAFDEARRVEEQEASRLIAEQERLARENAEAESVRRALETGEAERNARDKAERGRLAREKAEQERLIREKAEAEQRAAKQAEAERLAREKAEQERLEWDRKEQERLRREKAEAERQAAEAERVARERAEKEQRELLQQEGAARADADRLAREKAQQEKVEPERAAQEERARPKVASEQKTVRPRILSLAQAYELHLLAREKEGVQMQAAEKAEVERREKERADYVILGSLVIAIIVVAAAIWYFSH